MRSLRLVACAAVLAAVAACGIPYDDQPRALEPRELPLPSSLASPVADPDGDLVVALYFVREGQVELVPRPVDRPVGTAELVRLLIGGPAPEERAAGLISVLPPSLTVEEVTSTAGTAVLTLGGPDAEVESISSLGFAQIVATLTPRRVAGVRFRLDDEDLKVPQADGSLTASAVSRADYAELITAAPSPGPSPSSSSGRPEATAAPSASAAPPPA